MPTAFAHICSRAEASSEYEKLKLSGKVNTNLKPRPYGDGIAIPVFEGSIEIEFEEVERTDPHFLLEKLLDNPPKKWEKLGDLLIFPNGTNTENWPLSDVAEALGASRIAIQDEIDSGVERKSQLKLILGSDAWVIHRENFVDYEFDASEVMFSSGNITERRRMGEIDCKGEIIIDAYCGIGYYTLQFLKRGNAKHVHACEINPKSIECLERGLIRNGVEERCTIYPGDNKNSMRDLVGIADRVILGLIPSSLNSWGNAIRCLKPSGGIIHVHMNVHEDEIEEWKEKTVTWFSTVSGKNVEAMRLEDVKSYCPHIQHVVLDLKIS